MFKLKKLWMGPENKVINEGFDNLFDIEDDYKMPAPTAEVKTRLNSMTDSGIQENKKEGFDAAMESVFGRKQGNENYERANFNSSPLQVVQHGTNGVNIVVVEPRSFEDSLEIVNNLKERKSVIVNLQYLDQEMSQRVIDFVSGATLALDGTQERVGHGVFIFASMNCTVQTENISHKSYKDLFGKAFN